jgi:flagellar motor switch protein FliN/FliY
MSHGIESHEAGRSSAVRPSGLLAGDHGAPPADILARAVDFPALTAKPAEGGAGTLDRLLDVTMTVTAELGRVTLPISSILKLGTNSIVELGRNIADPIDLMVQGVCLARAEVVVVGDSFAVRIKEIVEPRGPKAAKG